VYHTPLRLQLQFYDVIFSLVIIRLSRSLLYDNNKHNGHFPAQHWSEGHNSGFCWSKDDGGGEWWQLEL